MRLSIENKIKSLIRYKRQIHLEFDFPYSDSVYGLPLKIQGELLLMQKISDFQLDGFEIVKISNISNLRSNQFERFSEKVLKGEREFEKLSIPAEIQLDDWVSALESLKATKENIIVEWFDEEEDDAVFFIGQINELDKNSFLFEQFDAAGKWHKPWPVPYKNIINISLRTRYIEIFTKYVEKK